MLQTSPVFVSQYPSKLVLGESSVPESSITTANIGNLSNVDSIVSAPAVDNRNSLKEGNFNPVLMFFFRLQACVLLISLCQNFLCRCHLQWNQGFWQGIKDLLRLT